MPPAVDVVVAVVRRGVRRVMDAGMECLRSSPLLRASPSPAEPWPGRPDLLGVVIMTVGGVMAEAIAPEAAAVETDDVDTAVLVTTVGLLLLDRNGSEIAMAEQRPSMVRR